MVYTCLHMTQSNQKRAVSIQFLSDRELQELTEYQRKSDQRKELSRLGIRFKVSRSGRPLVLKETIQTMFSPKAKNDAGFQPPDLQALGKVE